MSSKLELFQKLKEFVGFDEDDVANLVKAGPILEPYFAPIADQFYGTIGKYPLAAKHVEGRVDKLKTTHKLWMKSLFEGTYDEEYFDWRWKIGMVHVYEGIEPHWMESVMNIIRTGLLEALAKELGDAEETAKIYSSILRVLDLDVLVINLSYSEDRLDRLTDFTGMKRGLIENIIKLPKARPS